jgi:hypothetical protein
MRRLAPVFGLLVLAPWVGEFLLGNISVRFFVGLPFLVPLYGGGALLIREAARRTGGGWPAILLLGAAYGVIEAGLVDQTLFHPPLSAASTPVLGVSAYNAMSFVVGHAVWSIAVPIAIVELLTPSRRTTPWLGRSGMAITAAVYVFGCWIIFDDMRTTEHFMARPAQRIAAAAVASALIVLGLALRRSPGAGQRQPPPPWLLGVGTFVMSGAFFARPETWFGVGFGIALLVVAAVLVGVWSRQAGWTVRHQFALVAGALPTYAWGGFVLTWLLEPDDPVRWIGNAVFALAAGALLLVVHRVARPAPVPASPAP